MISQEQFDVVKRIQISNPGSATHLLCVLLQVNFPLWASVSLAVKWVGRSISSLLFLPSLINSRILELGVEWTGHLKKCSAWLFRPREKKHLSSQFCLPRVVKMRSAELVQHTMHAIYLLLFPDGPLITLTEGLLNIIHQLSHPYPNSEKCGLLFPCSMWMYGGSGRTCDWGCTVRQGVRM